MGHALLRALPTLSLTTLQMPQKRAQHVILTVKHAQDHHSHNVRVARQQGRCLATEDVSPPATRDNTLTPRVNHANNVIHLVAAAQGRKTINVCHAARSKSCVAEHAYLPRASDQRK